MLGNQRPVRRKCVSKPWLLALGAALALVSARPECVAGVVLDANAKGSVNNLLTITARYDALDAAPVAYLAGTLTASLGGSPAFDAYCVDLYHVLYVGGAGSSFLVNVLPIAQLAAPGGNGGGVGFLYQTDAHLVTTDVEGAALQVAIWKVEYDNGGSLTSGHFTVLDSADLHSNQHLVFAQATTDLAAYNGTQSGLAAWLDATSHPFDGHYVLNQNLVGPAGFVPTPEPRSLAAGLLGVAAVAGVVFRRRLQVLF